jgi:hypothetical protein
MDFIEKLSSRLNKERPITLRNVNVDNILSGLTSNKAHFIYELLQNAEDSISQNVKFILKDKQLQFYNDGKEFLESDIEGLVYIGHSPKKDSIGKFGMGFKSIFSISKMPEVYSGSFAFRFIEPLNVEKIYVEKKTNGAKFIVPFFEEFHPIDKTYSMLKDEIRGIDPKILLFLDNISNIELNVNNQKIIINKEILSEEEIEDGQIIKTVNLKVVSDDTSVSQFKVFQRARKRVKGKNDFVQIAYKIDPNNQLIEKLHENQYCFFPTKVETDLPFLIQAPFDINVSRELFINPSEVNDEINNELVELFKSSIIYFKSENIISLDFLNMFPFPGEYNWVWRKNPFIKKFIKSFVELMKIVPIIPTELGYSLPKDVTIPPEVNIIELFDLNKTESLGIKPWIDSEIRQSRYNQLKRFFIQELGIEQISTNFILDLLNENFFSKQGKDWLINFYKFLSNHENSYDKSKLRQVPFVLTSKNIFTSLSDQNDEIQVYFEGKEDVNYKIIEPNLLTDKSIINFFEKFGVKKASKIDEIKKQIISKFRIPNPDINHDEYYKYLKEIVEFYNNKNTNKDDRENLLRSVNKVNIIRIVHNKKVRFKKISESYLYSDKLATYFNDYNNVYLFKPSFNDESFESLLKKTFVEWGIKVNPLLISYQREHEEFESHILIPDNALRYEPLIINTFEGLVEALATINKEKSIFIWDMLINHIKKGFSNWKSQISTTNIQYNFRRGLRTKSIESELIIHLKNTPWIYDDKGDHFHPKDIFLKEISNDYYRDTELISDFATLLGFRPEILAANFSKEMREKYDLTKDIPIDDLKKLLDKHNEKEEATKRKSDEPKTKIKINILEWNPTKFSQKKQRSGSKSSGSTRRINSRLAASRGKEGEQNVFLYLKEQHCEKDNFEYKSNFFTYIEDGNKYKITWMNKTIEASNPYDILVEKNENHHEYIEVKSRLSVNPSWIEISYNEWEKAKELYENGLGESYKLYIIFGDGDDEKYDIFIISDIINKCNEGKIEKRSSSYQLHI